MSSSQSLVWADFEKVTNSQFSHHSLRKMLQRPDALREVLISSGRGVVQSKFRLMRFNHYHDTLLISTFWYTFSSCSRTFIHSQDMSAVRSTTQLAYPPLVVRF